MNPYHYRITVTAKKFAATMRYRIVLTPLIRHRALAFHATGSLRLVPHPSLSFRASLSLGEGYPWRSLSSLGSLALTVATIYGLPTGNRKGAPMLTDWYQFGTSCQIASAPQYGKSKGAEYFIREHAMNGVPFGLIDFHGRFFHQVLNYLAYLRSKTPIYLLNPSEPNLINPFNPFKFTGGDMTAHISRHTDSIIKGWGQENSNEQPTYERLMKLVLAVSAVSGEPLHHAAKILQKPKKELREWAISIMDDEALKQELTELQYLSLLKTGFKEWKHEVLSVHNRLQRFIGSAAVKTFTGLPDGIDIDHIWNEGGILLANIAPSQHLSLESAKVFGSLLQSEFLHAARLHMDEERPYFLYLDEFQGYATTDAVALINETPKTGLRLTFIYHHHSEFHDKPHIADALEMGAQIKIAFGGLPYELASRTAPDFWPDELNERQKKDDRVHYVTFHDQEEYETEGRTESTTEGSTYGSTDSFTNSESENEYIATSGISFGTAYSDSSTSATGESHSIQRGTRYRPRVERILDGQEDYTLEEKRSKLAGRLMSLRRGECYVKLPGQEARRWEVPWVEEVLLNPQTVIQFEKDTQTKAIPFHAAEQRLKDQEKAFFERSRPHVPSPTVRPKKKLATLHRQG